MTIKAFDETFVETELVNRSDRWVLEKIGKVWLEAAEIHMWRRIYRNLAGQIEKKRITIKESKREFIKVIETLKIKNCMTFHLI